MSINFMQRYFTEGNYSKEGSTFSNQKGVKFLILTRKYTTPTKPKNYIIAKIKGEDYYISSMYPVDDNNNYRVEYASKYYHLSINNDQLSIKRIAND